MDISVRQLEVAQSSPITWRPRANIAILTALEFIYALMQSRCWIIVPMLDPDHDDVSTREIVVGGS